MLFRRHMAEYANQHRASGELCLERDTEAEVTLFFGKHGLQRVKHTVRTTSICGITAAFLPRNAAVSSLAI